MNEDAVSLDVSKGQLPSSVPLDALWRALWLEVG